MDIEQPVFIDDKIRRLDIFRLPDREMPSCVSERFVERASESHLAGIDFDEVATI